MGPNSTKEMQYNMSVHIQELIDSIHKETFSQSFAMFIWKLTPDSSFLFKNNVSLLIIEYR